MAKIFFIGILFNFLSLVGFYLAYLYGRKTKKFRWSEYLAIIILPLACISFLSYLEGFKILILFILSCFVGFALEYIVGLTYHKTLNERLWKYNRFGFGGYTSFLSLPLWGIAGIVFYFLGKMIGL